MLDRVNASPAATKDGTFAAMGVRQEMLMALAGLERQAGDALPELARYQYRQPAR